MEETIKKVDEFNLEITSTNVNVRKISKENLLQEKERYLAEIVKIDEKLKLFNSEPIAE